MSPCENDLKLGTERLREDLHEESDCLIASVGARVLVNFGDSWGL